MIEQERDKQIEHLVGQIIEIKPDWIYLGVKLSTKTFDSSENEAEIHKKWNDIDFKLADLNKRLRALQAVYHVDFFDDRGVLVTAQVILNKRIIINTKQNGWTLYMSKKNVNQLLIDIWEQLKKMANNPEIQHVCLIS